MPSPLGTHRYRLTGLLPLLLFSARYARLAAQGRGQANHIMWICHLSSLVMPLRFGLCRIERVRHSVLWLIIGLPLWPSDILRTGIAEPTSLPRLGGAVPRLLELRLPIGSGVIPGAPSLVGRPPIQFKWSST